MASYTSNLNLKKPALTDDALVTDLNDNSDKLDAAISAGSGAIAIVSVGNTHAAISSGQYVYVRQHGSLSEGLYKATTNIAANGTLSGSNLTAVSGGGLNSVYSALSDQIENIGTIVGSTQVSTSASSKSDSIARSISLPQGTWLITATIRFVGSSGNAIFNISETQNNASWSNALGTVKNIEFETAISATKLVSNNNNKTYYMNTYNNSSSSITYSSTMEAIRIK